jgi:MFS family permease
MTAMTTSPSAAPRPTRASRLWRRELEHYPSFGPRMVSLAIVVLTTILFYYQYYAISGVSDQVIASTGISFVFFVNINVISALASAVTSLAAGVADRWGRANIVTIGVLLCALVCLFGLPNSHSGWAVGFWYTVLGAIEGTVLVATPALVRDFSPQLGRASAMSFWTLGPVVGSLIVSAVVSNTVDHLKAWQDQYIIAGIAGLGVFVISALWLRELTPEIRDQIMVSERDRALVEARAKGIDVEAALKRPYRQMLHLDIIGSAVAISVFLMIYFVAVGFFPLFFQTIFGFSTSQANALGNWMWGSQAGSLLVIGYLSDKLRVRKPFMLVGGIGAAVCTLVLIHDTGQPKTSYYDFVVVLVLLATFLGMAFAPWMAGFTETVERRNPALTATGLSLWGLVIRIVVTVSTFILPYVVNTVTTLVKDGPVVQAAVDGKDPQLTPTQNATVKLVAADPGIAAKVQTLAAKYRTQLATADKLKPTTQAALSANPTDPVTQAEAVSEISGKSLADVTRTITLSTRYADQLVTATAIDISTQLALLNNAADPAAQAKAVGEIAAARKITPAQAVAKLQALAAVPSADLLFLNGTADPVQKAADALTALAAVPPADLAYLNKYGTPLQDKKVQAALAYLQDKGPKVQKAAADSPGQWQNYFWITFGGEIVFLPLIFVMAGFWSPRRARQQEQEHAAMVDAELAKLAAGDPTASSAS